LRQIRFAALILLFLSLPAIASAAQRTWALCKTPAAPPPPPQQPLEPDTPIDLTADQAHMKARGTSVLLGDVKMWRDGQFLRADELYYTPARQHILARGHIRFENQGLTVIGPKAELQLNSNKASFARPRYRYAPRHARGQASRIYRQSPDVAVLEDATYTTCEPGDNDWLLSANKVTLDRKSGAGTARNVVVRFKNVPLLYTPWIRFPIDNRRKSGFLFPGAGFSNRSGFMLEVPYYWNIAPNRDATFTPRILSERGLQLQSEFRYLNPSNSGELDFEFLDDRKADDLRYIARIRHSGSPLPRVRTVIDASRVSDDDYFEDFGNSLSVASTPYLQQRADVTYEGGFWDALARVQNFQIIDSRFPSIVEPYARLPQILLAGALPDQRFGLGYDLNAEWVNFANDERITGRRLDLDLGVEQPFTGASYFIDPSLHLHYTRYSLDETNALFPDANITRTLPIVSLDSGLLFDRLLAGGKILQTLQPRLFYLYVPYQKQDDIPIFDTTRLDFSFAQLFRKNRFSGPDRIGDANQLALALTSRFLRTDTGLEILSANIGGILYFDDRRITLLNQPSMDDSTSDLAAGLTLNLNNRWTASADALWAPHEHEVDLGAARLRYLGANNRVLNVAYRFLRTNPQIFALTQDIHQTDIAFAWPLSDHWSAVGRWNYDLVVQRNLELLAGFEYESCCYKLRFAARRFVIGDEIGGQISDETRYNNSIEVQLVLKGLAQLGSPLGELLERGILGYRSYD
jgi:LPS-assembly protein